MFTGEKLIDFLDLLARGYTVKRLKELMAERGHDLSTVPDVALIEEMRGCDTQVEAQRAELDKRTRTHFGLARKLERVRRLCEAAEAIEKYAFESTRWSAEYRRYLSQIQEELEPLGLKVEIGDSWAELLMDLAKIGTKDVDKGEAGTES